MEISYLVPNEHLIPIQYNDLREYPSDIPKKFVNLLYRNTDP